MADKPSTTMTEEARQRLRVLDAEGHSASAISKALWDEFGICKSRSAVGGMIQRMGLAKVRGKRTTAGMTLNHRKFDHGAILDMFAAGLSQAEIAARVGMSRPGISGIISKARVEGDARVAKKLEVAQAVMTVDVPCFKHTTDGTPKSASVSLPRLSILDKKPAQSCVSNNHVGGRSLRPVAVAAPDAPPVPDGGVPLVDLLHHHCRAISGRGADGLATFCGADKVHGSYCAAHARMFYAPASSRSEAA